MSIRELHASEERWKERAWSTIVIALPSALFVTLPLCGEVASDVSSVGKLQPSLDPWPKCATMGKLDLPFSGWSFPTTSISSNPSKAGPQAKAVGSASKPPRSVRSSLTRQSFASKVKHVAMQSKQIRSWTEEKKSKDVLHMQDCRELGCEKCLYLSLTLKWERYLTLDPTKKLKKMASSRPGICLPSKDSLWITKTCDQVGHVFVGCIACRQLVQEKDRPDWHCPWSDIKVAVTDLKLSKIQKHAASQRHRHAVASLQGSPDDMTRGPHGWCIVGSPALDDIFEVWRTAGSQPERGTHVEKILWSLSEALKERTRHRLSQADSIGLIRDERRGRLLIRYRAVLCKSLECVSGVLGVCRWVRPHCHQCCHQPGHSQLHGATNRDS